MTFKNPPARRARTEPPDTARVSGLGQDSPRSPSRTGALGCGGSGLKGPGAPYLSPAGLSVHLMARSDGRCPMRPIRTRPSTDQPRGSADARGGPEYCWATSMSARRTAAPNQPARAYGVSRVTIRIQAVCAASLACNRPESAKGGEKRDQRSWDCEYP
jgi:hypothetical protein